jgi:hypothetical protein
MSGKKTYAVLSPVQIAGEIVKEGVVECTPEEAAPVLATGSLKELAEGEAPPAAPVKKTSRKTKKA